MTCDMILPSMYIMHGNQHQQPSHSRWSFLELRHGFRILAKSIDLGGHRRPKGAHWRNMPMLITWTMFPWANGSMRTSNHNETGVWAHGIHGWLTSVANIYIYISVDQNLNGRRTYVARLEKDQSLMRLDQLLIGKWLITLFSCFLKAKTTKQSWPSPSSLVIDH